MEQSKKFPCEVDTQIELKNVTTLPNNNGIELAIFGLGSVPVLWL
jgi:hypothetical protein